MFIDTKNGRVTVWLAKFPPILAEQIKKLKKETKIGCISKESDDSAQGKTTFSLSEELLSLGLPTKYDIVLTEITSNMYVLRTDFQPKIEGTISRDCNIRPVINKEYIAYKKKISDQKTSLKPVCETITLREANTTDKILGVADIDFLSKKRKKMLSEKKRGRIDKNDVMNMIFNAYEESDSWTVKDMSVKINQPIVYTQEIMNEICLLNKKDHRNTWDLKPEYKSRK